MQGKKSLEVAYILGIIHPFDVEALRSILSRMLGGMKAVNGCFVDGENFYGEYQ